MELLNQFSEGLINIPKTIIDALLNVTEDEDEKAIINAYSSTLNSQFSELSQLLISKYEMASRQNQSEVDNFMKVSAANELIKQIAPLSLNLGSIIGKIGLAKIIQEIKKIIKFILGLLNLPTWLSELILLIDQIINNLLGSGSVAIAASLSIIEQNYLKELTRFAELKKQEAYLYSAFSEEENP